MDCQTVRLLLALDDPADQPSTDAHVQGCAGCQAFLAGQAGFDAALSLAMKAVPLPAGGADRAYAAANARRAWLIRRRWAVGTALVLATALAVPAGYGLFLRSRPVVDPAELAQQFDRRRDDPEGFARDWLQAQGLPPALPYRFDYRHLLDCTQADVPGTGRTAPCVQFVRGADALKVYVLRRSRFRTADLLPAQSSFATVLPVPEASDHPGVAYLLLFTSPTLDTFLRPADLPQ